MILFSVSFAQETPESKKTDTYQAIPTNVFITHQGILSKNDTSKTELVMECFRDEENKWHKQKTYFANKSSYMFLMPIPKKKKRNFRITFITEGYETTTKEIEIDINDKRPMINLGDVLMTKSK
jgi:hypothetical protein